MAGYGILNSLIGEIKVLTETELARSVSKEVEEYTKGRKLAEADIEKYAATIRAKHNKKNAENRKKLELKRLDEISKYAEKQEERIAAKKEKYALELEDLKAQRTELLESSKDRKQQARLTKEEASQKRIQDAIERSKTALTHNIELLHSLPGKAMQSVTKGVNEYIGAFSKYFTAIEVGLQGTNRGFRDTKELLDRVIGLNPAVKQTEVLERLETYIKSGVLRDAELRATLSTVGTKIVNTFNSLDPTLLSLTKILGEDTTMGRLGMEASLTRYLAGAYQDTSYFANNTREYVSAQMLQAMSQLGKEQGASLEYSVQKWLGSFVSVGVTEETAKKIADGIGYLASGNIGGLTGNTELMNLMLAAANRGGINIASVMQGGADEGIIDKLMQGLYSQVSEIARSGNQVVKSQYAGLYGLSLADIAAMQNLSQEEVNKNLTKNLSLSEMEKYTKDDLRKITSRIATSTMIDNAVDNLMSILGEKIASEPVANIMWKLADMATSAGGIRLPGALALGTGLAQLPDVDQLMKGGLMLTSMLSSVGDVVGLLGSVGKIDIDKFGKSIDSRSSAEQTTIGRLSAEVASASNVGATYVGDISKETMYKSSMAQIQDIVELTGQDMEIEEKGASSGDIDRLIRVIEDEGRKNRGEFTIQNVGPLSTVRFG